MTDSRTAGTRAYLLESYLPKREEAECRATAERARRAAAALSKNGSFVRYVRSMFVTEDETCFHVFEATSADAVAETARRADLSFVRISAMTEEPTGVPTMQQG